jgi:hypothetical protein
MIQSKQNSIMMLVPNTTIIIFFFVPLNLNFYNQVQGTTTIVANKQEWLDLYWTVEEMP